VESPALIGCLPPEGGQIVRLVETLRSLEAWGADRQWLGPDPSEGLNAERLSILKTRPLGRRLLIQLVKRSPVDLRPVLRIRPAYDAAGLAQVAAAYARSTFLSPEARDAKLRNTLRILGNLRRTEYDVPCWSYHFDGETRVGSYPRTMPNTIATSFVGMALIDAYELTGEGRLLELAVGTGEFFLRYIRQTEAEDRGAYFGYWVGNTTPIHNANMLVCALLARLFQHTGRDELRRSAEAGVAYCLERQRGDGSWPYGEQPNLMWVDGFHTGYVLESLLACLSAGIDDRIPDAVERGLDFYRRALFLAGGTPKYFANRIYPIDAQCVAQGIQTFARATMLDAGYEDWAWKVFGFALARMRRRDGAFIFQRGRLWRNSTPHIRWVEAPMFLALTHLHNSARVGG
jgi:hypothetical protein